MGFDRDLPSPTSFSGDTRTGYGPRRPIIPNIDPNMQYPVTKAVAEGAPPGPADYGRLHRWFLRRFRPDKYLAMLRADTARKQRMIASMDAENA